MAGSSANTRDMRAIGALCQDVGLRVLEAAGWEDRGRDWSVLRPEFVVCHHTAATIDIDRMLAEGRPGLPGPICNFALHADGTVVLIASGLANHAGVATLSSDQAYGIEATGPIPLSDFGPEAFPQYDAYVLLVAAIRRHHGWGNDRVTSHKEIARPLGRKIDPSFVMDTFRDQVEDFVREWPTAQEDDVTPEELRTELMHFGKVLTTGKHTGKWNTTTGADYDLATWPSLASVRTDVLGRLTQVVYRVIRGANSAFNETTQPANEPAPSTRDLETKLDALAERLEVIAASLPDPVTEPPPS